MEKARSTLGNEGRVVATQRSLPSSLPLGGIICAGRRLRRRRRRRCGGRRRRLSRETLASSFISVMSAGETLLPTNIIVSYDHLVLRPAASRHARDADRAGPAGLGRREADGRGDGQEVRLRGGLLRRQTQLVAENQAQNLVHVRRALLFIRGQGGQMNFPSLHFSVRFVGGETSSFGCGNGRDPLRRHFRGNDEGEVLLLVVLLAKSPQRRGLMMAAQKKGAVNFPPLSLLPSPRGKGKEAFSLIISF